MEYLKVKNWEKFQHYKDRNPPWIKLHVKILNDRKFCMLSRASKCLLLLLWILASENDGMIPNDLTELRFRLRDDSISETEINQLIKGGFLNNCKHVQADDSKQYPETETEKRQRRDRTEKPNPQADCLLDDNFLKTAKQYLINPGYIEQDFISHCEAFGFEPDEVRKLI